MDDGDTPIPAETPTGAGGSTGSGDQPIPSEQTTPTNRGLPSETMRTVHGSRSPEGVRVLRESPVSDDD
jgi:hypothetical protein